MVRHALPGQWILALLLAGLACAAEARDGNRRPLPAPQTAAGRGRDPFRRPEGELEAPRPRGLAGVGVLEAVVRGVVHLAGPTDERTAEGDFGWAILEAPSGTGFVAGPGARLLDGIVDRVEEEGVLFLLGGDPDRTVFRPLATPGTEPGKGNR